MSVARAGEPSGRARLAQWVESRLVQRVIITLILINAVTLGLETSAAIMADYGVLIKTLDTAILTVFVVEITLRIIAHGWRFFRDPWSVFDFIVVAIGLIPEGGNLAVLRALRVLRVLRLITMVPQMRSVVGALLAAIPGLSSIVVILLIIYYVFAVIATNLFGQAFPEWFGTIAHSMYTLFQVMTLESWSMGIVRPVMEQYPWAWTFFIPYILIATFTMLNLFIAIIVNAMQSQQQAEQEKTVQAMEESIGAVDAHVHADIVKLQEEVRALRELLQERRDGSRE